jgi:tRNA-2-methylthio-N6-dimethylallyladenosine synthase
VLTEFDNEENYLGQSAKLLSPFSTHVTIQRGCNKHCSYCIVPYVRGPEKYREVSDVLREVREAADKGVSEITLLGQTVNAYKSGNDTFATLLNKVSEVPGIQRIRFVSPHPRHYTPDLIDILLNNPKLCQSAHIPLQSGSDAILKKMRRQHTADDFLCIVEKLRGANPLYGLSTDIISGFVGETEADFEKTLDMVREVRFDSAFMFIYSPRKGTESAQEKETLSAEEKWERQARLVELQNEITLERNRLMLGRNELILVERPSSKNPDEWVGKTNNFKKVIFKPVGEVHPGNYLVCNIDDIRGWTLRGTPISQ